jgi:hypothetical protein
LSLDSNSEDELTDEFDAPASDKIRHFTADGFCQITVAGPVVKPGLSGLNKQISHFYPTKLKCRPGGRTNGTALV